MSELELVWIRECEVCHEEHQHFETHAIESIDEVEIGIESIAFKRRCERWYKEHLKLAEAQHLSVAGVDA